MRDEPVGVGHPAVPAHLTQAQRELWAVVSRSLPPGLLSAADEAPLERMAVAWAAFRDVTEKISRAGFLAKGSMGQLTLSPLVAAQAIFARQMHLAGEALGLSPVARSRLTAPENVDDDPLAILLGSHQDGAYQVAEVTRRRQ